MAKAYSLDLRIRVVNQVKIGKGSHQDIADRFEIGVATLRRWIRLYKDNGSVAHRVPLVTRPRKVDYKKAKVFIEKNPDKTLAEIGLFIGTKNARYVMSQLGITYKKTLSLRGKAGRFARRIPKTVKSNSKGKSYLS